MNESSKNISLKYNTIYSNGYFSKPISTCNINLDMPWPLFYFYYQIKYQNVIFVAGDQLFIIIWSEGFACGFLINWYVFISSFPTTKRLIKTRMIMGRTLVKSFQNESCAYCIDLPHVNRFKN